MGVRFSGKFVPLGKLKISNPSSSVIAPSIVSIEGPLIFNEGNVGTTTTYAFIVNRTGNISRPITLQYNVIGSGENPASPTDFEGSVFPSGNITLLAGQTSTSFAINVKGDEIVESDEEFTVQLSSNLTFVEFEENEAIGIILNDDVSQIAFDPPSGSLGTFDMETEVDLKINVSIDSDLIDGFEIIEGSLPPGLTMNPYSGNISGTLGTVEDDTVYGFVVKATAIDGGYGLADYSITVRDTVLDIVWITPEGTLVDAPSGYGFKKKLEAELQ